MLEIQREQGMATIREVFRRSGAHKRALMRPGRIHYLHIGKTGGNQIKTLCNAIEAEGLKFSLHGHSMQLRRLPSQAEYFFSIRRPETRFVSAFYERKRQGRSGRNIWSEAERLAFLEFEDATNLADAIFSEGAQGELARAAMHSIQHLRQFQASWFQSFGFFLHTRPPIAIIRQEKLDEDFNRFCEQLGVTEPPNIQVTPAQAKITNYDEIPPLSELGIANLRHWYAVDNAFYSDCVNWSESMGVR